MKNQDPRRTKRLALVLSINDLERMKQKILGTRKNKKDLGSTCSTFAVEYDDQAEMVHYFGEMFHDVDRTYKAKAVA